MADEWRVLSLEEAGVDLIDCVHKTPPDAGDGYPYIAIPQMNAGRIDFSADPRRISYEDFLAWTAKAKPRLNDVVLSRRCNPGETAHVPDGVEFALGQNLVLLRSKGTHVDTAFLRWLVRGPQWWVQVSRFLNVGAVFDSLRCADIPNFELLIPPLPEQRAIAHILGTLDDKIELNRRMSETLEAMARALFKSWFVDFDPVRAKAEGRDPDLPQPLADLFPARLVGSELGEIPEGWEVKPLDEIAHFQNGLALQKYRPKEGEHRLPVVKIAQLRSGRADGGEWATENLKPECVIDDGDVVFSWSGSLLVKVWTGGRAALNQHLFKVTSADYPRWFFLDAILSHLPDFRRIAAGKATTMGHIQRHHLTSALCVAPDEDVLRAVGSLFSSLLERSASNDVQSRTLQTLRDALLPKLISGALRIREAERFVAKAALRTDKVVS